MTTLTLTTTVTTSKRVRTNYIGTNINSNKSAIGVITYRTATGKENQCPVLTPFWGDKATPDVVDTIYFLLENGHPMARRDTIRYNSLK